MFHLLLTGLLLVHALHFISSVLLDYTLHYHFMNYILKYFRILSSPLECVKVVPAANHCRRAFPLRIERAIPFDFNCVHTLVPLCFITIQTIV